MSRGYLPTGAAAVLPLAVALLALAACRPAEPVAAGPGAGAGLDTPAAAAATASDAVASAEGMRETQWQCGDQRVAARFDPQADALTLTHDRGQLLLPRASAASGARYADANGNEFWDHGNEAMLTLSGTPARDCVGPSGAGPG